MNIRRILINCHKKTGYKIVKITVFSCDAFNSQRGILAVSNQPATAGSRRSRVGG